MSDVPVHLEDIKPPILWVKVAEKWPERGWVWITNGQIVWLKDGRDPFMIIEEDWYWAQAQIDYPEIPMMARR